MPVAYEGKKPYIFVSYSHKDKTEVMRYIDALEKRGFLVWFDGGVEAGSEWPEYIANRLADSACVLAFISPNFVKSQNCRRELALTQELEKEQLNVHMRKVELSMGMRMQLGLNQAIWRENFATETAFLDELCKARVIRSCKDGAGAQAQPTRQPSQPTAPQPAKASPAAPQAKQAAGSAAQTVPGPKDAAPGPVERRLRGRSVRLGWTACILELLYIPISWYLMEFMTFFDVSAWWLFVNMIVPHTVIAGINKIRFLRLRKAMTKAQMDKTPLTDAAFATFLCLIVATLASVIGGAFHLEIYDPFIMLLLYALGLNVVPFLIAGFMTIIEVAD